MRNMIANFVPVSIVYTCASLNQLTKCVTMAERSGNRLDVRKNTYVILKAFQFANEEIEHTK